MIPEYFTREFMAKMALYLSPLNKKELNEYVITKELKKHFIQFFNAYNKSFDEFNTDTGVWISGFFGSGKSHFLKILGL